MHWHWKQGLNSNRCLLGHIGVFRPLMMVFIINLTPASAILRFDKYIPFVFRMLTE